MYPFWFGLIFPFVAVHLFNWVMFIIIIICLAKNRKNVKKKKELKRHFFLVVGLSLVFGLGWGLGLLATSSETEKLSFTFQILFSILIGSQGVLIFFIPCDSCTSSKGAVEKVIYQVFLPKVYLCHFLGLSV